MCATPYAEGTVALPQGETYWIAVRCRFQCRSCGHLSPLNHLDMDGSVTCLRCGLDQVFDVESWRDGLQHAMRTGQPEHRGTFPELGVSASSAELVQSGLKIADGIMTTLSLRVDAGPGHPLCPRCREPLGVELDAGGVATSRCPTCGDGMRCALPGQARGMCKPIRAVLAEELALDRREASIDAPATGTAVGAIAIKCPHCSAPLKVTGASTIVTCEYCQASSRIPSRTMFRLGHDHPVPQVWWLQYARIAPKKPRPPRPPRDASAAQPPRPTEARSPRPPPPISNAPGMLGALGVLALVGVVGFRDHVERWRRGAAAATTATTPAERPAAPTRRPGPAGTEPPAPSTRPFVALAGCRCGTTQIHVQVTPSGDGAAIVFRADRPGRPPVELHTLETEARRLGLAVACHRDDLALVLEDRVHAWSLERGDARWDRPLGASYRFQGATPADGISLYCTALPTSGGKATVPTGTRGRVSVDLATGAIRTLR